MKISVNKSSIIIIIVFFIVIGFFISRIDAIRYKYISGPQMMMYKIDRITGEVFFITAGGNVRKIISKSGGLDTFFKVDKSFDVASARVAGYSDDEILLFLAQKHGFDYKAAVAAGYASGDIIGGLAVANPRGQMDKDKETPAIKAIDVEAVNGYFVDNKNIGKIFVIEASIKNTTDSPQNVSSVVGSVFDSKGAKLTSRAGSPGKIVSKDDLKNFLKDDLAKAFTGTGGGIIPARGSVPVMVVFTEVPAGLSEYGIEVK